MKTISTALLVFFGSLGSAGATDGDYVPAFGATGWSRVAVPHLMFMWPADLDLARQSDGKIIVAAGTGTYTPSMTSDFSVARLHANGALDPGFGAGGRQVIAFDIGGMNLDGVSQVLIQPDGRIVICGSAVGASESRFAVARLNANGSFDTTFGNGGRALVAFTETHGFTGMGLATSCALGADGRLVVAGSASTTLQPDASLTVAIRLMPNGSLDTSFNATGYASVDFGPDYPETMATAVAILADNSVLMAGHVGANDEQGRWLLSRLTENGTLDSGFGTGGKRVIEQGAAGYVTRNLIGLDVRPDGSFVVVGGMTPPQDRDKTDFGIAKFHANGASDPTFAGTGFLAVPFDLGGWNDADMALDVVRDSIGRLIVVGHSSTTTGTEMAIVRVNPDGTLDSTFGDAGKLTIHASTSAGGSDTNDVASAALIGADGHLLVGGSSASDASPTFVQAAVAKLYIERLLTNGFERQ